MKVSLPKEYNFIRFINGGYHGNIYLVMKGNQYSVLKEIVDLQGGINELVFLTKIKHKHIIKLLDYFVYNNKLYFEFYYYGNGSLLGRVNNGLISEYEVSKWKKQLEEVVKYCHMNNFYHNDLKLNNILIDKNHNIILIDFGCSEFINRNSYDKDNIDNINLAKIIKILEENKLFSKI